jgi:hypothetical protein
VTTNTSTNREEVYRIGSWNTRERSQRFALVVAGCDPYEIASDCLQQLEARFSDFRYDSIVGVCYVSSVESIAYDQSYFSISQLSRAGAEAGKIGGAS